MFTARILGACNIFQSEHLQVLWLSLRGADLKEITRIRRKKENTHMWKQRPHGEESGGERVK